MNLPPRSPYPPHRAISAHEAREADLRAAREFGLPGLVLMEHAGRGLAEVVWDVAAGASGPVAILCGPGQNGGDGLAAARFLVSFGVVVRVARLGARQPSGDAAVEWTALSREIGIPILVSEDDVLAWTRVAFEGASVVVDALYGVGLDRPLDAPSACAVRAMNEARAPRVAADLPSGLDAETGLARPLCVRADVTAAMGFVKLGCRTDEGARWCGRIVEIDIGLPRAIHGPFRADAAPQPSAPRPGD